MLLTQTGYFQMESIRQHGDSHWIDHWFAKTPEPLIDSISGRWIEIGLKVIRIRHLPSPLSTLENILLPTGLLCAAVIVVSDTWIFLLMIFWLPMSGPR
jgi:hypothetical protein